MSGTVAFATLGCRLNQVDTGELQGALEARGLTTVPLEDPTADVVVINTCTVTSRADVSDRQTIHRAVRSHPRARIVVTGCWAQVDPGAVARVAGVDLVVGNADKARLPDLIERLIAEPRPPSARVEVGPVAGRRPDPVMRPAPGTRSRAFVKIQDGCQHRCAFCVVPFARGGSRSRDPKLVVEQIAGLVAQGFRDVTLTGIDMGHYGWDLVPRTTLAALLDAAVRIRGLRWIRLSSILPAYFTPELVEIVGDSPVIAPHLHIPLQSGSDRVLRRMRRPYSVAMYRRLIDRLAARIPVLGLGTDVIAGFPGETEDDFEATCALVSALPFTYLHVFPYSDRPGTEAASLDGHVPAREIAARARRLRALGQAKNLAFRRRLVDTSQDVLVLETRDRDHGDLVGLTGHYVEVVFPGPDALCRTVTTVRITAAEPRRTLGVPA